MKSIPNLLRALVPASLITFAGCALLILLFAITFADILMQVGCEQCFGLESTRMLVTNGVEEREVYEESESPGLPPGESVDQEPEDPAILAFISEACDALFELLDLSATGDAGPSQGVAIRSGGFAVAASSDPAARYDPDQQGGQAATAVYLTNAMDDTVMAIDLSRGAIVGSVGVGRRPRGIAVTPDGARLFVANEDSGNVYVVETSGLTVADRIPLPGNAEPYDVAITPDGAEAWVTSHEAPGVVHIIDTATLAVADSVRVGRLPVQVAISPDGTLAYVTNEDDNRLSVLDVWTHSVQRSVNVPSPYAVEFDPVGSRVYVTSHSNPGTVRMIDVASDEVLATWEVGMKPEFMALDAFAGRLFVTNRLSPFLSVINLLSGEVEREIAVPRGLGPLALAPQ